MLQAARWFLPAVLLCGWLSACAPNASPGGQDTQLSPYGAGADAGRRETGRITPFDATDGGRRELNPNLFRGPGFQANPTDLADQLAGRLARIPGVKNATVVIAGGNVYVGLDLDRRTPPQVADRICDEARSLVRGKLSRYDVYVTADRSITGRLMEIRDGWRNGTPLDNYNGDLLRIRRSIETAP
ncbi:MAG: YhcN/YlaJ family sporulation lipoprotein [Bacillota bacterium]